MVKKSQFVKISSVGSEWVGDVKSRWADSIGLPQAPRFFPVKKGHFEATFRRLQKYAKGWNVMLEKRSRPMQVWLRWKNAFHRPGHFFPTLPTAPPPPPLPLPASACLPVCVRSYCSRLLSAEVGSATPYPASPRSLYLPVPRSTSPVPSLHLSPVPALCHRYWLYSGTHSFYSFINSE
jgi:hypothetical protein